MNESPAVSDQSFDLAENSANGTSVGLVNASDVDSGDSLTYAITGGTGATAFAINGLTGEITVADASQLDYESTTSLTLNVEVTDDGVPSLSDSAIVTINLTPLNDNDPVFTSSGTVSVAENVTFVTTVTATDADLPIQTVTYSLNGGADSAMFALNGTNGDLTFLAPPDFETPGDVNGDNVYEVNVRAFDGNGGTEDQSLLITVTDVQRSTGGERSAVQRGGKQRQRHQRRPGGCQ